MKLVPIYFMKCYLAIYGVYVVIWNWSIFVLIALLLVVVLIIFLK